MENILKYLLLSAAIYAQTSEIRAQDSIFLRLLQEAISTRKQNINLGYKILEEKKQEENISLQMYKAQTIWNAICFNLLKKFHFFPVYSEEYKHILKTKRDNILLDVISNMIISKYTQKKKENIIISQNETQDLSFLKDKGICDRVTNNIDSKLDKYTFWARIVAPTNDKEEIEKNREILKLLVNNPNVTRELLNNRKELQAYENFLLLFDKTSSCFDRYDFNDVNYNLGFLSEAIKISTEMYKNKKTYRFYNYKYLFNGNSIAKEEEEDFRWLDTFNPLYMLIRTANNNNLLKKIFIQYQLSRIFFIIAPTFLGFIIDLIFGTLIIRKIFLGLGIFLFLINLIGDYKTLMRVAIFFVAVVVLALVLVFIICFEDLLKCAQTENGSKIFNLGIITLGVTFFGVLVKNSIEFINTPVDYGKEDFYRKLFFSHIKDNVMKDIKGYLGNMKNFYNTIKNNTQLYALLGPMLTASNNLFATDYKDNESLSSDQKEMFSLLYQENPTKKSMVKFLYLFDQNRDLFTEVIQEQAYLSTYLYSAENVLSGKYCIADFRDSKDQYINLKDVRHVMLGDDAISNDVELGEQSADGFRNFIFNGMNATGKTVMMETIIDAVIIAQSIGIAPCKYYEATIFDKIFTAFGTATDILSNYSKFMSELKQIDSLIDFSKSNKNKKIIIGCDEICSGTDPETGENLVYNVFVEMMKNKNLSLLAATHYQLPRLIEKDYPELRCGNYMMKVSHDEDDNLLFLRKMYRGVPEHSLAVDITEDMIKKGIIKNLFRRLMRKKRKKKEGIIKDLFRRLMKKKVLCF